MATQVFPVAGLHCKGCVATVTEELSELAGVDAVEVELVSDGVSTVTVSASRELDDDEVQAALTEGGEFHIAR